MCCFDGDYGWAGAYPQCRTKAFFRHSGLLFFFSLFSILLLFWISRTVGSFSIIPLGVTMEFVHGFCTSSSEN